MNSIAQRVGAIAILTIGAIYPQESFAVSFTGKDFAAWSQTSQDSFIQTSVTMAGVVATQTSPSVSSCIDGWYFADQTTIAKRNHFIRSTIAQYPKHHPSGVILAVLQKNCGSFK